MSALAFAPAPLIPRVRRRTRQRATNGLVVRAWWWSKGDGSKDDTSPKSSLYTEQARKDRVTQLSKSYVQHQTPPPSPHQYSIRTIPDQTTGSTKTRIEVVYREGEEDGDGEEGTSDASSSDVGKKKSNEKSTVVGWVTCWPRRNSSSLFLSSVEVKQEHRRRGLAKRLLQEVEELAVEKKCMQTSLTVLKNNSLAIALYEKAGYKIDDGDSSAVSKVGRLLMDPQRVLQHRMVKNVRRG